MVPVAQETTANTVRLPYSFSRRFSLVAWCEASLEILHVHPLSLSVLQELQRGLNASFTLRQIDEAEFEQRLNAVWQRDSSEARQLMEDLGSAEDFFTLAEELPETEDLLESDDDAPIIKLINAMLAEAIKEGASDIQLFYPGCAVLSFGAALATPAYQLLLNDKLADGAGAGWLATSHTLGYGLCALLVPLVSKTGVAIALIMAALFATILFTIVSVFIWHYRTIK